MEAESQTGVSLRSEIIQRSNPMDKEVEIQAAVFRRLLAHLDNRKDVQNIELMNLAGFCRNCLSRWFREEAEKKGLEITDPDARQHIYGMPYFLCGTFQL